MSDPTAVRSPLFALLDGLIDYAGLFPPAKLPLKEAFNNYSNYTSSDLSWMLDRFICPLSELAPLRKMNHDESGVPIRVSLIAPVPLNEIDLFRNFVDELHRFNEESRDVLVDAIEAKWNPANTDSSEFARVATVLNKEFSRQCGHLKALFIELPWTSTFPIADFADGLRPVGDDRPVEISLKVRTGGLEASAFPEPSQLARFVVSAHHASLKFKATAGMHHPVRRWDEATHAMMHGFLNVFWGASALYHGKITEQHLSEVLAEKDESAFSVSDDTISWGGISLSTAEIKSARRNFALSFGSCSFLEPVEDLQSLNLLPHTYARD